ncbi:MAG: hypothetical protein JRH20_21565 [Deltaproteobacteria bacterium]|nr:hypothetical protein [Deltaproteobacteria bacterium]
MSYQKNLLIGALLAAAWMLPQASWASGGRLPTGARNALMGVIRGNVAMPSWHNARLRTTRNQALSKGLVSTSYIRAARQQGRAYIYEAKLEVPHQKAQSMGRYLIAEKQSQNGQTYWEARPLAIPLRADGKASKQTTKRVTRPASGRGKIDVAFINTGLGVVQKSAAGITAKGATVARSNWDAGPKAEILAERVNFGSKTITYYALGMIDRNASGNRIEGQATAGTLVQGTIAPMFTSRPNAMPLPPGVTVPRQPPSRPDWLTVPVKATLKQKPAAALKTPPAFLSNKG